MQRISEELGDVLETMLDSVIFERVNHYLPTLERILNDHQADSVNDRGSSIEHQDDLAEMAGDIEDFRAIRDILADEGYR